MRFSRFLRFFMRFSRFFLRFFSNKVTKIFLTYLPLALDNGPPKIRFLLLVSISGVDEWKVQYKRGIGACLDASLARMVFCHRIESTLNRWVPFASMNLTLSFVQRLRHMRFPCWTHLEGSAPRFSQSVSPEFLSQTLLTLKKNRV